MIECRAGPVRGGVAALTARREPGARVIRVVRSLVIDFVTAIAVGWQTRIVTVHMATCTGHANVKAGERKRGVVMIKCALVPRECVVAHLAGGRKS